MSASAVFTNFMPRHYGGRGDPPYCGYVSAPTAARRARVSHRQVGYWAGTYPERLGVDIAQDGAGTDYPRRVRTADVPKLHVIGRLSEYGLRVADVVRLRPCDRMRLLGRIRKLYRDAGVQP